MFTLMLRGLRVNLAGQRISEETAFSEGVVAAYWTLAAAPRNAFLQCLRLMHSRLI